MNNKEINVREPFSNLFIIHNENYDEILSNMKVNGYDQNEPVIIWVEKNVLIDGHTRLRAAQELNIDDIPVMHVSFDDEDAAVQYAVKRNSMRRNVTKGDRLRLVRVLDNVKQRGGDHKSKSFKIKNPNLGDCLEKSSESLAKIIGVGHVTVEKMRTINQYGKIEDVEAVECNKMSIDEAWKKAKIEKEKIESEKKSTSQFNRTNDNIEWALWTWNPVTGCKYGCKYCYAKDIAERFYPQKFEPTFHPERLNAPINTPIPKEDNTGEHNVFVCSMADLFGDWIPDEWINAVLDTITNAPEWWNFLLLTKNPKRYLDIQFPKNCWIGATATNQQQMNAALNVFNELKRRHIPNTLFISCEPFMGKIILEPDDINYIDWLIIGGRSRSSGMPEGQPEWKWVADLLNYTHNSRVKVYFKPNLTVRPKEYPTQ